MMVQIHVSHSTGNQGGTLMTIKWAITISLIAVLSFLHAQASKAVFETHLLHQQLFFIPIILASFWFGLGSGLIVAVTVSLAFLSSILNHMHSPQIELSVYTQIGLYIFVAALIGWLTGQLKKRQQQALKDEKWRTTTKLASALSHEIQEIVGSLENQLLKNSGTGGENSINFQEEIAKLKRLTKAFEQFGPPETQEVISRDLNAIVKKTQRKFQGRANSSGIILSTELDKAGCPSMIVNETIVRLFEALVENAIEASPADSKIILRSTRMGSNCILEVVDSGPGISAEHVAHLFKPFFTTKTEGHGLTLAAGKKVMKDYQGDLLFEPAEGGGAIFKLVVPRENISKNIDGYILERIE